MKLTVLNFAEKYGLSIDHIYVNRGLGSLPDHIFSGDTRETFIDEGYILRRKEFKKKVKAFNQSMYYYVTEHFREAEYMRMVAETMGQNAGSLAQYARVGLFALDNSSILSYKLSKLEWVLFRFNRKLMLALNRKFGIKFDVEYILDRRMLNAS